MSHASMILALNAAKPQSFVLEFVRHLCKRRSVPMGGHSRHCPVSCSVPEEVIVGDPLTCCLCFRAGGGAPIFQRWTILPAPIFTFHSCQRRSPAAGQCSAVRRPSWLSFNSVVLAPAHSGVLFVIRPPFVLPCCWQGLSSLPLAPAVSLSKTTVTYFQNGAVVDSWPNQKQITLGEPGGRTS